jgi:FMN phosphatase YigB (HAD superfamily)
MPICAIIFDVYKTLLEVGPPPSDAEPRWIVLWKNRFGKKPSIDLAQLQADTDRIIRREHEDAWARGINYPEVYWPDVCAEALPEWRALPAMQLLTLLYEHAQLQRTIRLMEGAAPLLASLAHSSLPLGIASNSQPYTLNELHGALASAGLPHDLFQEDLCFWSFQAGFSKPNPHVFRMLTARLRLRGVLPKETLMVGDRQDNDVLPARTQGWQTWQLASAPPPNSPGGSWAQLEFYLRETRILQ